MGRRTTVNAPSISKMTLNSGRIVRIVRRIIYVCVATVDGSDPISGATEITPDITNITFFLFLCSHRMENRGRFDGRILAVGGGVNISPRKRGKRWTPATLR